MKTISRKEKIQFALDDYFFGYGKWTTFLRMFGGPFLLLAGIYLLQTELLIVFAAFGGIFIFYGIYMIVKPALLILLRLENYKAENIEIAIDGEYLIIKNEKNESRINFDSFLKIRERKKYYAFVMGKSHRLKIPKIFFDDEQIKVIEKKRKR